MAVGRWREYEWKRILALMVIVLVAGLVPFGFARLGMDTLQILGTSSFIVALGLIAVSEKYFDSVINFKLGVIMFVSGFVWFLITFQGTSQEEVQEHSIHAFYEAGSVALFIWFAMTIVEFYTLFGVFSWLRAKLMERGYSPRKQFIVGQAGTGLMSALLDNAASAAIMKVFNLSVFGHNDNNLKVATIGKVIRANTMGAATAIGDPPMILFWLAGAYGFMDPLKYSAIPCILASCVGTYVMSRRIDDTAVAPVNTSETEEEVEFHFTEWLVVLCGIAAFALAAYLLSQGAIAVVGLFWGVGALILFPQFLHARGVQSDRLRNDMLHAEREVERVTPLMVMGFLFAVFGLQGLGVIDVFAEHVGENPSTTVVILIVVALGLASSVIDNIPLAAVCLVLFGGITSPVFWVMVAVLLSTGGSYLLVGSAAGFMVMGSEELKKKVTFDVHARGAFLPQTIEYGMLVGMMVPIYLFFG